MIEEAKRESYLKRIKSSLLALSHRQVVVLICIIILLVPFPTTALPEWKVRVVDSDGNPVSGARVTRTWDDYTLGFHGGSELWTDADGYVVFPKQFITASLLRRIALPILSYVPINPHASTGFYASAWAVTENNSSEIIKLNLQNPLPSEIVLRS
jgi:hypothetical protein